jgi:outer membrane protein TolC
MFRFSSNSWRWAVAAGSGVIAVGAAAYGTERLAPSPSQAWIPPASGAIKAVADKPVVPDHELSLGDLIDLALRENPSTRRSWQIARQALAGQRQALMGYAPQVDVGVTFSKQYQKTDGALNVGGVSVSQVQVTNSDRVFVTPSLNLSWLLWDFGAREAGVAATKAALTAANYQHNRTLQDVVRQVQGAYFAFDAARGDLAAADAAVELAVANFRAAELQRRNGLVGLRDELQARQSATAAELQREQARQVHVAARSALLQLAGLPPGDQFRIAQQAAGTEPAPALAAVESLVAQALATRPDLAARYAQVESLEAQTKQAERGLWPSVTFSASASRNRGGQIVRTSSGVNNPDVVDQSGVSSYQQSGFIDAAQAGVSVNLDVTGVFARREAVAAKRAELDTARVELKTALNAARHEVWSNVDACRSAQTQLTQARAMLEACDQAFRATEQGHRSGLFSMLDLLNAQEQLARARSTLVQVRARLFTTAADLAYATGATAVSGG